MTDRIIKFKPDVKFIFLQKLGVNLHEYFLVR